MYIGDSASLSFLQTVRKFVTLAVGECDFTVDPQRHTILETVPSLPMMLSSEFLPLKYDDVAYLARQYLLATAGLTDMLEMDTFWHELEEWANDPARDLHQRSCIFYLVIAIGAQVSFDASRQMEAEQYYSRGRQLAFYNFTEAPSLMTVQAYTLISVYMLGACRRNGAFMNFGIACQATFALGMHVRYSKGTFDERETRARRYTWRSVRLLDSFFAASLGRPPATSDPEMMSNKDQPDKDGSGDFTDKVLSLATIYDRIVLEVYIKKAVSTRLAESISRQLQTWTEGLPTSLDLQALPSYDENRLPEILAATHIISTYHWAIILLTRPFLTSQILQDMARKKASRPGQPSKTRIKPDDPAIKMFADACVNSALKSLAAVENLIQYRTLPRRLPVLINAVCNIALVLGAAVFADQDKTFPLLSGLEQALHVLRHFTPHDPHASRYEQIISYLSDAVKKYIYGRDRQKGPRSKELSQSLGVGSNPSPETENGQARLGVSSSSVDRSVDSSSTPRVLLEPYDPVTPVSFARTPNHLPELLQFAVPGPTPYPDSMLPPSTIFDESQFAFPNDAYLFMEQEPSIFSFWTGG